MDVDATKTVPANKKPPFIFYLILVALPVIFFIVLEFGLRLADYGHAYRVFIKKEQGVNGMLYVNPDITYKYFGNLSSPVFNAEVGFYAEKPESTFRIFVLGGSSTQGFPYNPQASFPAHLKRRLALLYPDKYIEVINLGASAINSYTIGDILPAVLEQSADLILIYAGHNEYYGALGAGSAKSVNPGLANLILFLRDFRTVQLIENLISRVGSQAANANKSLMQRMIGQSLIAFGSDTYQRGIDQYRRNLSDILQAISKTEIPVLIGSLTSNIADQQPLNSEQKSKAGLSANEYFYKGKELLKAGKSGEAKSNLVLAKEYDGLRFRAPEAMNEVIAELSTTFEVPLVDINQNFNKKSPAKVTGANLMCDHLHPNREGYFLMSKIFTEAIIANNILPAPYSNINAAVLDSLLIEKFPYTAFDTIVDDHILYSGLGQYPFVAADEPNPYQEILDNDGVNFNTASINTRDSIRTLIVANHLRKSDTSAFLKEMQVFLSYFPTNETRYLHAINLLSQQNVLIQAYPILYESLQVLEESNAKNKALGMYHKTMQEYATALKYLQVAMAKDPEDVIVLLDIGFIQLALKKYIEAEEAFNAVILLDPDNQEAYHQRSIVRFEQKNYAGTIEDITASMNLKDSPDTLSYIIRGYAYLGVNDRKSACQDWQASAKLGSKQGQMLVRNYCQN
jgi:lysophospholipase L1-like esterase/tetratricopeptide (TPR) repeat protein